MWNDGGGKCYTKSAAVFGVFFCIASLCISSAETQVRCQGIRVGQKAHNFVGEDQNTVRRHCQVPQDAVTQCGGTRKHTRLRGAWKTNVEFTNDLLATKSPTRDL